MRGLLYIVVAFSIAFGCTTNVSTTANSDFTEAEVRAFISQYDNAWNTKDSITVNKVLSDDYIYFNSEGGINRKKETIAFLRDTAYVIHSAKREDIDVTIHGNLATVSSHWIGELAWKGNAIHDNQRCGITVAKVDGKIEIISEHCVAIKQH